MTLSQTELKTLHKLCFQNERLIQDAKQAGCFCCLEVFPTGSIREWLSDHLSQTACCPHCGVDSVLADDENFKLSQDLLKQIQTRYFLSDIDAREPRYFNTFAELMHASQTAEENSEKTGLAFCMRV